MLDGFDVAKAEVLGMAQRGGSIAAHVRIGDLVFSPLIERGNGDIIVGFEVLEAARALPMLKPKGTVVVNTKYIPPSSLFQSSAKPLQPEELLAMIQKKASRVYEVDGMAIAGKLGNLMVVNTVLLGAVSVLPENPVKEESFKQAISSLLKENYISLNLQAFEAGRESVFLR